ncbi:MAG: hypothetical protein QM754_07900 [Tepidisphaeraceae bacterium]
MKKQNSKGRAVYRIQLTADAKDRLLGLTDGVGITQIAMMTRLVEWFAKQPEAVQAAVLGFYPEPIRQDVAKMVLAKLVKGK